MAKHQVAVVGAGIIGLSSALNVQESCPDCHVTVISETFTPDTTSDESGGFWYPYCLDSTDLATIRDTAKSTYRHLKQLALSPEGPSLGINLTSGYFLDQTNTYENDPMLAMAEGVHRMTAEELEPYPGYSMGFSWHSCIVNVSMYQAWMTTRFIAKGGKFVKRKVQSLSELAGQFDVAVICCGMGAASLLNDSQMYPIRGQIIRVEAPWVNHFYNFKRENGIMSYILPNSKWVTIGGTAQVGDWNTRVDEETEKKIWDNAVEALPHLTHAKKIKSWAGLRPARTKLRLETEVIGQGSHELRIVHNYGHGGAGVTLHWGCAQIVVQMVNDLLKLKPKCSTSTVGLKPTLSHKL